MRRVVMTLGLLVGLAAWVVGIVGMVGVPGAHVIPVPDRLTVFGIFAMMGTLTLFVVAFAHGARAGDVD